MVPRINPFLLIAVAAACADHALTTDSLPLEEMDSGVVLYASLATYPVAGADLQSLALSVSGGGATSQGQRFIGYHAWNISWRVETMPQSDGCRIADATVFVDSRITLPDWEAPPNPDLSLATQWADFLAALREHEAGHQALVMRGAERVRQTLRAVHGPRCEPLAARADSAAQAVLASIRDDDARYDAETRHGATQGAIWPPASLSPVVAAVR